MGFGLLFMGYFLTVNFEYLGVNIPPDFLGYILMIAACYKLSPYSDNFKKTIYTLIPLTVLSVGITAIEVICAIDKTITIGYLADIRNLKYIVMVVMHYFLLNALVDISRDVGRYKITNKCRRNLIISVAILLFVLIFTLPFSFPLKSSILFIATVILLNFMVILNSIQIFSCYMWICYEGDEDMPVGEAKDPLSKLIQKTKKENAEYRAEKKKADEGKKSKKKKK